MWFFVTGSFGGLILCDSVRQPDYQIEATILSYPNGNPLCGLKGKSSEAIFITLSRSDISGYCN
jgi:hypothetical protein